MLNIAKLVFATCFVSAVVWAQSAAVPASTVLSTRQPVTTAALQDSVKLRPVNTALAVYPEQAKEKQLQGQVVLKFLVEESGEVLHAEVVSGDPILATAALDAIRQWKFEPFIKNGKPIKVIGSMPFDFAFSGHVRDVSEEELLAIAPANREVQGGVLLASATSTVPQRVRVSQRVMQGLLVHQVQPLYPPDALAGRVQGAVVLQGVIAKDGRLSELRVISGHPLLAPAAVGAVEQWRYRPYRLNGEPVEVETQITVNFGLSER